jgi:5,5'-dehydrodivanillate O-demethylase
VRIKAYKVEELGGLIFAYMGPEPAPLLPRWDILVWEGRRFAYSVELPCNWLQCQENSLDPLHFQWLHRYWGGWVMNRKKPPEERDEWNRRTAARGADHKRIGFEITNYGVIKRRLVGDETVTDDHWAIGHPVLFPNILRVGATLQFRVPVDDETTLHVRYEYYHPEPGQTPNSGLDVDYEERSLYDEDGKIRRDYVMDQDMAAWVIQGPIMDRTTERLGVSDVGLIMYRRMLSEQAAIVEEGGEPMGVFRDPVENEIIVLPIENFQYPGREEIGGPFRGTTPREPDVEAALSGEGQRLAEWEQAKA